MRARLPAFKPVSASAAVAPAEQAAPSKGKITYLEPSAPFDPELVPDKLFSCVASFGITGLGLSDAYFHNARSEPETIERIRAALAPQPPSLSVIHTEDCDPYFLGRDKAAWEPSISNGHFSISRSGGRYDFKDYKLVLYVPNQVTARELKNHAVSLQASQNLDMSVGQFLSLPQFEQARSLAVRNVCRAAEAIAGALGVKLVDYEPDPKAARLGRGQPMASIAKPEALSIFGSMTRADVRWDTGETRDLIVVSDRMCSPLDISGRPVLQLGALNGVALVNSSTEHLSHYHISKAELEQLAVPVGPVSVAAEHNENDRAYISNVCFWDSSKAKLPKQLLGSSHSPAHLQAKIEQAFGKSSVRYEHVISYQAT